MHRFFITGRDMLLIKLNPNNGKILMRSQPDYFEDIYFFYFGCCFFEYAFAGLLSLLLFLSSVVIKQCSSSKPRNYH